MIDEAQKILREVGEAILKTSQNLDSNFSEALDILSNCTGRIIVTGLGKSGHIGNKIAATFASTGTPSYFVHASEALHGDLGMIRQEDILIAISHSGETNELIQIIPPLKRKGIKIISMTKNKTSSLAKYSNVVLATNIEKEAGELGLAPTSSTTVTLALGDALALCLLKKKNFKPEDFALLHPGGSLGKKLGLRVEEVMHSGEKNAVVSLNASIKDALFELTSKRLGGVNIVDSEGKLVGLVTDGDLRRAIETFEGDFFHKRLDEIMTKNPLSITNDKLGAEALHLMEDRPFQIMVLPVVDFSNKVVGMIRVHDLVKAGVV